MKQKDFLIILIPLFILTILWVVFNIYHNHVTSTIKDPLTFQIIPIEGKFDTNSINKIKNRQRVNPLYEKQSQINTTPIPTDEPTSTEISSQSAEILPTATPEASQ